MMEERLWQGRIVEKTYEMNPLSLNLMFKEYVLKRAIKHMNELGCNLAFIPNIKISKGEFQGLG